MADEIDIANDRMMKEMEARIAASRITNRVKGSAWCAECDEPVPTARRELGYSTCIECATRIERLKKHRP